MTYDKVSQYGPLPIRIIAGIAFIIHGLPKLSNVAGTEHFFANMVGLPAAMALPIGLLEVIGGIALLIVKEAVHELGHVFGLTHCGNIKCVMYFSNSLSDTDIKTSHLCNACRGHLV